MLFSLSALFFLAFVLSALAGSIWKLRLGGDIRKIFALIAAYPLCAAANRKKDYGIQSKQHILGGTKRNPLLA